MALNAGHSTRGGHGRDHPGFVMTSVFISDIYAHIQSLILYCILLFCTALVVALGLSRGAGGPAAPLPAGLPPHRTAGALSAAGGGAQRGGGRLWWPPTPKGKVVFANQTACRLLQKSEKALKGRKLNQVFPESSCVQAARTGEAVHNRSCVNQRPSVLSSEIPSGKVRLQRGAERLSR